MRPKINFITIAVTDLKKSVAFYKDNLGLPTTGIQDGNEEHCLFELENDFSLVLYRRKDFLQPTGNPNQTEKSAGFIISHIAESKEQVDDILHKALNAGATQIGQTQNQPWGYSANFGDPDGHQWEITFSMLHSTAKTYHRLSFTERPKIDDPWARCLKTKNFNKSVIINLYGEMD
jgi:predicted lactoylglutathione lyase